MLDEWVLGRAEDIPWTAEFDLTTMSCTPLSGRSAGRCMRAAGSTLDGFLTETGFRVEHQYGDWRRGPVTAASREIVTLARAI